MAFDPLMMNMAARSTYWATSLTRYVRTSDRLVPFSISARKARSVSNPGPAGRAGHRGVIGHDLRHGRRDLAFVDLLVVAGDRFGQLVERADEVPLVFGDLPLDRHHPVGHLLVDEAQRLRLEIVF